MLGCAIPEERGEGREGRIEGEESRRLAPATDDAAVDSCAGCARAGRTTDDGNSARATANLLFGPGARDTKGGGGLWLSRRTKDRKKNVGPFYMRGHQARLRQKENAAVDCYHHHARRAAQRRPYSHPEGPLLQKGGGFFKKACQRKKSKSPSPHVLGPAPRHSLLHAANTLGSFLNKENPKKKKRRREKKT